MQHGKVMQEIAKPSLLAPNPTALTTMISTAPLKRGPGAHKLKSQADFTCVFLESTYQVLKWPSVSTKIKNHRSNDTKMICVQSRGEEIPEVRTRDGDIKQKLQMFPSDCSPPPPPLHPRNTELSELRKRPVDFGPSASGQANPHSGGGD